MAKAKEKGIMLLGSTVVTVGSNGVALNQQALYTFPPGKHGIVEYIVPREPSSTLVNCTDVNIGIGDGATGKWIDAQSLAAMTETDDYMTLERTSHIANEYSVIDGDDATTANRTFGIRVITSTAAAAATVTIDVFGYLWDA